MADFTALKTAIQTAIKQNGNEEITGAILQEVLLSIVNTMGDGAINSLTSALSTETTNRQNADGTLQSNINNEATARQNADGTLQSNINAEATARQNADSGLQNSINSLQTAVNSINTRLAEGYVYVGIATAATNPGTPAGKVFYIATAAGTYTNFNGLTVTQGITILKYNGTAWSQEQLIGIDDVPTKESNKLVKSGGVFANIGAFDISEYHKSGSTLATYADLTAALAALPSDFQKGGISVKYVQTSDNKYVQYRLTKKSFSTSPSDWIDDTNKVVNDAFYVTDSNGYVIAKIYSGGVNSVDFKINGVSVNDLIASTVGIEEERAKAAEDSKLNRVIDSNSFCVTDENGYIIFKIDNAGAHAPNIFEGTINDDKIVISDKNDYIVAKIDRNGVHCAKDKHAVACMVLSESYYPIATPTRDSDGNITYVEVMFETGIEGNLTITYTNGNSSSVAVVYGNYNYTITINRNIDGNVETVSVN